MALALTPVERLTHARCRAAGIPSDSPESAARLPPCATCTLSFARAASDLGGPDVAEDTILREIASDFSCFVKRDAFRATASCEQTRKARICDLPPDLAPFGTRLFASWELAEFDDCDAEETATQKQALITAAADLWEAYSEYHIKHNDLSDNPTPKAVLTWTTGKLTTEGWRVPAHLARLHKAALMPSLGLAADDAPGTPDAPDAPAPVSGVADINTLIFRNLLATRLAGIENKIGEMNTTITSSSQDQAAFFTNMVASVRDLTLDVKKEMSEMAAALRVLQGKVEALCEAQAEATDTSMAEAADSTGEK
ncbi:LOW QUALITY PROTEIN: hypothetical protein B0H65DRAFT_443201 [Neurospora tetraspora]|uniref:Uncharacterized protein n=1 Tax=Neurospora tetraspora TaxID=94610 RepID=A0AAE0MRF9_9PEZI|nr:LOW QUALITY PROTEIN: hypothetical protein B0H65DRAFT_443201 [Neurospora tetraspora]